MLTCRKCEITRDAGNQRDSTICGRFTDSREYDPTSYRLTYYEHDLDCCNCKNRAGNMTIRCRQCLQRPFAARDDCKADHPGSPPENFRSIHLEDLEPLLSLMISRGDLGVDDVQDITFNHLRECLVSGRHEHPAKRYPQLFSNEFPHCVLTIEWPRDMKGVLKVLNDLEKSAGALGAAGPRWDPFVNARALADLAKLSNKRA
jgi:hypothetical protein